MLSPEEVLTFIESAPTRRDRMLLQTAYACGLRIEELMHLRVADIDSARMVLEPLGPCRHVAQRRINAL